PIYLSIELESILQRYSSVNRIMKSNHFYFLKMRVEPRIRTRPFLCKGWVFLFWNLLEEMKRMITIHFPDGNSKDFENGVTGEEIAQSISPGLKKQALAIKMDGKPIDLRTPLEEGGSIEILTYRDQEGIEIMRHSTDHLMAQALKRLYGEVQFGVGPVIEEGFYYDFDMKETITSEDFPKIEKEMQRIIDENLEIVREEVSCEEAKEIFRDIGDELKVELIDDIPEEETVTIYRQGEFFDLCRGVHVPQTSKIKAFKLLSISGAYWRGDSNNQQLQRIYGTAFEKEKELKDHLNLLQERRE